MQKKENDYVGRVNLGLVKLLVSWLALYVWHWKQQSDYSATIGFRPHWRHLTFGRCVRCWQQVTSSRWDTGSDDVTWHWTDDPYTGIAAWCHTPCHWRRLIRGGQTLHGTPAAAIKRQRINSPIGSCLQYQRRCTTVVSVPSSTCPYPPSPSLSLSTPHPAQFCHITTASPNVLTLWRPLFPYAYS